MKCGRGRLAGVLYVLVLLALMPSRYARVDVAFLTLLSLRFLMATTASVFSRVARLRAFRSPEDSAALIAASLRASNSGSAFSRFIVVLLIFRRFGSRMTPFCLLLAASRLSG